jgi:membrane protein DedA with SNARE-associated domain
LSAIKYTASLMLILMGSLDCLTTVIGTVYFGTQELNPIIAGLVNTNLPAFVAVKLAVTISVGVVFVLAEKALLSNSNVHDKSFKAAYVTLRVAYIGVVLFLLLVVINNIMVLLSTL